MRIGLTGGGATVDRMIEQAIEAEVEGFQNAEAATKGQIVFLTVPFRAQSETLTNLKQALSAIGQAT